jgi:dienelactone hydrolase
MPYIDTSRGLIVGQSFGGQTAIAAASLNIDGVVAAVNFSGGSGGGNPDEWKPAFEQFLKEVGF